jgi:predicted transcriptional regulator
MICPSCGYDNFDGVDECAECLTSMTHEDIPSEKALDRIERALLEVTVSHLGPAKPITIPEEAGLHEAVERMRSDRIGALLITDAEDRLSGILTERDLLNAIALEVDDLQKKRVADYMTPKPETIEPERPLAYALQRMTVGDLRHLPLVDEENRSVGVISSRDIINHLAAVVGVR